MANKTGKSVSMWDERERRIKRVMKWINAIPPIEWSRATRAALIPRIRSEWPGIDRDAKAEALLADAERVLAGVVTLESLRGGRPREFIRKVSVSDLEQIRASLATLEQDMNARKGAYIHAGAELDALISSARALVNTYLEPA